MKITNPIKRFINAHKEDINLDKWGDIYSALNTNYYIVTGEFTSLMYEAGLNPLAGLDYIPNSFYTSQPIQTFYIPDGIVEILPFAFSSTYLSSISIPNTVKRIDSYTFLNCIQLSVIEYRGTVEEFENTFSIEDRNNWIPIPSTVIKCIDGNLTKKSWMEN